MKHVVLALLTLLLAFPAYAQQPSPKGGANSASQVRELPPMAKRWALVIGVDRYDDPQIGALDGAATDARTLRDALIETAGFPPDQVVVLASGEPEARWPTRPNILHRLTNLVNKMPQDGLFLLAFSGHGIERERKAYLLPKDAQLGDSWFLEQTAISLNLIRDRIESSGIAQVVLLLDSCRNDPGGRSTAPNRMSDAYVRPLTFDRLNHKIRAFATLYATAIGERAYEYAEKHQGYFTWAVVEGLEGAAANEKGEVTLSRLVHYVQETVPKRVAVDLGGGSEQLPWANIEGYLADDLVLAVKAPMIPPPPPSPSTRATDISITQPAYDAKAATEVKFWESVEKLNTATAYDEYLRNYPSGTYASLARMNKATIDARRFAAQSEVETAFRGGDYAKARGLLQKAADGGDVEAESRLGSMALLGLGTACSTPEATRLLDSAAQKGSRTAEAWLGYLWATRGGSRTRGLEYAKASAERGDPVGLVALATAYEYGITIPPDLEAADRLYKQALPDLRARAEQDGDPWAFETLGNLYARGRGGITSNSENALALFQKAAEHGLPQAKSSLVFDYEEHSTLVRKDRSKKAIALYEEAAAQREPEALCKLGERYLSGGDGLRQSYQKALDLFRKAADSGYPAAQSALAHMYAEGLGVAKDDFRAAELYTLAASQGNPIALSNLAAMHVRGEAGLDEDDQIIVDLYRKGAERGDRRSQFNVAVMYDRGFRGVASDQAKAAMWYAKAAEQGYAQAETNLGLMYKAGAGGLPKDDTKAVDWFRKAALQGDAVGENDLGASYALGVGGLEKNESLAVEWYRKAADQGDAMAQNNLAWRYELGIGGLTKDIDKAVDLYRKSAAQGYEDAKKNLARLSR